MGLAATENPPPSGVPLGQQHGLSVPHDPGDQHHGGGVSPAGLLLPNEDAAATDIQWYGDGGQGVPTRRGLDSSPAVFLWESRTTNVDVMSVSNTTRPIAVSR